MTKENVTLWGHISASAIGGALLFNLDRILARFAIFLTRRILEWLVGTLGAKNKGENRMSDLLDLQLGPDAKLAVKMDGANPEIQISGSFTIKGLKGSGDISLEVQTVEDLELIKALAPTNQWVVGGVNLLEGLVQKFAPAAPAAPASV